MASPCRIVADTEALARRGEALVHDLEARWSRFRADSEVSFVNGSGGAPCRVTAATLTLFQRAEQARAATDGAFNPFVLDRLELLGYGPEARGSDEPVVAEPVPHSPIDVLAPAQLVTLPAGLRFDPGGIGKGLAADLVTDDLVAAGATSLQIELGGDVRVHGPNWTDGEWNVDVVDPRDRSARIGCLGVTHGGIATSSVLGTRWSTHGREHHHLIDGATGLPAETDLLSVTATSSELWWAEVIAKVAVMAGSRRAPQIMRHHGCAGLMLTVDGGVHTVATDVDTNTTNEESRR